MPKRVRELILHPKRGVTSRRSCPQAHLSQHGHSSLRWTIHRDSLKKTVVWRGKKGVDQSPRLGVKVQFEVKNADLYSFRFSQ